MVNIPPWVEQLSVVFGYNVVDVVILQKEYYFGKFNCKFSKFN